MRRLAHPGPTTTAWVWAEMVSRSTVQHISQEKDSRDPHSFPGAILVGILSIRAPCGLPLPRPLLARFRLPLPPSSFFLGSMLLQTPRPLPFWRFVPALCAPSAIAPSIGRALKPMTGNTNDMCHPIHCDDVARSISPFVRWLFEAAFHTESAGSFFSAMLSPLPPHHRVGEARRVSKPETEAAGVEFSLHADLGRFDFHELVDVERRDDAAKVRACRSKQGKVQRIELCHDLVQDLPRESQDGAGGGRGRHAAGMMGIVPVPRAGKYR